MKCAFRKEIERRKKTGEKGQTVNYEGIMMYNNAVVYDSDPVIIGMCLNCALPFDECPENNTQGRPRK